MEAKEVVVLSAKGVEHSGLEALLSAGQGDNAVYTFKFVETLDTSFPQDSLVHVNPGSIVIFLWDPKRLNTLECFKKTLQEFKSKKNPIMFCHLGNESVSVRDKTLLDKWVKEFVLADRYFSLEEGIDAEAAQKLLLSEIIRALQLKKSEDVLIAVPLNDAPPKAYFEYEHKELDRNHSRQKRADFINTEFAPDAQGQFSADYLMQLFAIYMSLPLNSTLSKAVEKMLAKALMSEYENAKYLATIDSSRSTIRGKGWDRISTQLRKLLEQRFSQAYPQQMFTGIMDVLIELQNCVTSHETAWGYKLWGGKGQIELVDNTIENTMTLMKRIYPCLLRPKLTAEDRETLQLNGMQLPTEVINIIDRMFPKSGSRLEK